MVLSSISSVWFPLSYVVIVATSIIPSGLHIVGFVRWTIRLGVNDESLKDDPKLASLLV